jgi:hypothetical protein
MAVVRWQGETARTSSWAPLFFHLFSFGFWARMGLLYVILSIFNHLFIVGVPPRL